MEIDWNDDEAVVRAACPYLQTNAKGPSQWITLRKLKQVIAFEQANRPVQEAAGDGFEEDWLLDEAMKEGKRQLRALPKNTYIQSSNERSAHEAGVICGYRAGFRAAWTACADRKQK